jgi:large subunit ribosomal protein L11
MPPKKKKISGFIKLQINAGAATPPRPSARPWVSTASTSWSSSRRTTRPPSTSAAASSPSRSPSTKTGLHLRHQDAAGRRADQEGRRDRQGLREPHKTKVAKLTAEQVREIAQQKLVDLNANDVEMAARIIAGTARSMGVQTEGY